MELIVLVIVAVAGACLSFLSGFGLGTLLLPAFLLFFPLPVAIAATAVVHMLNNIFKLFLVGRYADRQMVITFGITSVIGALAGAWFLGKLTFEGVLFTYNIGTAVFNVTMVKLVIAVLIIIFSILEIAPWFKSITISRKILPAGGLVSGFFGGLSGHQGALRSAFLMKTGLSKEAFMGTRVVCACLVDLSRLAVYAVTIGSVYDRIDILPVTVATLAAFSGAWLGNKWMKKTELKIINNVITACLILFAIALGMGLI